MQPRNRKMLALALSGALMACAAQTSEPQAYIASEQAAIDLAISKVHAVKPISQDAVTNLRIRAIEWPDGSLGCPEPGREYTQRVVPGFFVSFTADGEIYTVHVGDGAAVVCGRINEVLAERRQQGQAIMHAHQAARIDLAAKLFVDPEEIIVTGIKAERWPNSNLGCPDERNDHQEGPVDGLRINMSCRGREYEYRTRLDGKDTFISCQEIVSCHETE